MEMDYILLSILMTNNICILNAKLISVIKFSLLSINPTLKQLLLYKSMDPVSGLYYSILMKTVMPWMTVLSKDTKNYNKNSKAQFLRDTFTIFSLKLCLFLLICSDLLLVLSKKSKTLNFNTKISPWISIVEKVYLNILWNWVISFSNLLKNVWLFMRDFSDTNLPSLNMTKFSVPNLTAEPWKMPD